MQRFLKGTIAAAAVAAGIMLAGSGPAAAQLAGPRMAANLAAAETAATTVQWRRRGALIGGALVMPREYDGDPYPYPYAAYPPYDDAIAYCMRRFETYDPYSMTYLGSDGRRYPCP